MCVTDIEKTDALRLKQVAEKVVKVEIEGTCVGAPLIEKQMWIHPI